MRTTTVVAAALALAWTAAPARAQQPDYLAPDEVELVRAEEDPNKKVELFLGFANLRLASFEKAVAPGAEPLRPYELRDRLNDFIRAVDDTTDKLQQPFERGGVELKKARDKAKTRAQDFLKRLELARQTEAVAADEDLRYDLDDAVEAVNELVELAKKIPDGVIPAKTLPALEAEGESSAPEPASGKPTLKRRTDKPKDEKPKP